jgi:hypothetical protein
VGSPRLSRNRSIGSYLNYLDEKSKYSEYRTDYSSNIATNAVTEASLAEELEIIQKSIQSGNYIPGEAGWKITGEGDAEFGNVFVRGDITAYSGAIGYWNISSPAVTRVIGPYTLLGTFLESSGIGDDDESVSSGTYVGLFKSYSPDPFDVSKKSRVSGVATITILDHDFVVGDNIIVDIEDDESFNSDGRVVQIVEADYTTISFVNPGPDVADSDSVGYVYLSNKDTAGLYLKDYSKREFDYGYFSSAGVSYVSAEDINVIENPSFEYKNSLNVLTPDHTTSWTAGVGLNYNLETFSTPSLSRPYKNSSAYGGRLTWNGSGVSTYLSSTIDYAAGTAYQVFGFGRSLHFGATIFPRYTPPATAPVQFVKSYIISGTITSASATTTTITYNASSGLTFSAGQYITVSGFTNPRLNVDRAKINTATSTTITVELAGDAATTESLSTNVTSNLLEVITFTSHSISAGNTVFLDVGVEYQNVILGADFSTTYNPHTIADGTLGYTFTVSASPAPSGTTLYLITDEVSMPATGTIFDLVSLTSKDGTTRTDRNIYKAYEVALDMSSITISYPNVATTTPLYDVLASGTKAEWDAGLNKYLIGTANEYILGWVDSDVGISALTKPSDILLDGESIDTAYRLADPVGYADGADIKLNIPGWLVFHDGNGVVPLSPTKISAAGYIIDNVYLSTAPNFFYGSDLITNRWYEGVDEIPAGASIEGTKSWISVDLDNQSASLDYFDYIGFRNNTFSKTMMARPSIGVFDSESTYLKFPDAEYETTTFTGGKYQYVSSTAYTNVSPSLKLLTGDRSVSFELAASTKNVDGGNESVTNSAVIAGIYNDLTDQSAVYISSDKFVWTNSPEDIDIVSNAKITFTSALAYFNQKIQTASSIVAAGNITTSAGFTGNNIRLNSTTAYSLITTNHPFQIGFNSSDNLRMDRDGIQAVSNEAVSTLNINTFGGTINAGSSTSTFTVNGYLRVESTNDVSLGSTNHSFQIGPTGGVNLRMDNNEIQAVNNGAANTINIQASGGNTVIGAGGGDVTVGNSTSTGNLILGSTAGTPGTQLFYRWAATSSIGSASTLSVASSGLVGRATSSRRFKQNIENLSVDVLSVLSVMPKKFKYTTDIEQYGDNAPVAYGFIAEELHELGLTEFVDYDELGDPFSIEYSKYVVALQAVVKYQASQIKSMGDRLDALEGK